MLACCESNHYLLKCSSLGLFVALLQAWAVFHIPLRLMRTVLGPVAVILTNWSCSCFSFYSPIYCNLKHCSYCNRDDLDLMLCASRGRIIILNIVTAYPGSEVSGHWLIANLLAQEWWQCWKIWQNNWLILQMIMIFLKSDGPSGQPKYRPR